VPAAVSMVPGGADLPMQARSVLLLRVRREPLV
jgi:hypothetical protein